MHQKLNIKMHRMSLRFQNIGRSLSERSALSPRSSDENSYGSFLLSLGGLTQSLRRATSYQVNRIEDHCINTMIDQ